MYWCLRYMLRIGIWFVVYLIIFMEMSVFFGWFGFGLISIVFGVSFVVLSRVIVL